MKNPKTERPLRVLIASSHALFAQGLRSLLNARGKPVEVIGMVSSIQEAMEALEKFSPDLVIVDYDDELLNRDEFLARFVEGEKTLRVVLLSLQDGEHALVYDRRTLAASQIDDWLEDSTPLKAEPSSKKPGRRPNTARQNRRGNMKHFIIAGFLVILVTALTIFGLSQLHLLPAAASLQAQPIDRMFTLEFIVIAFLFALIVVFMLYSILVFRRKKGDTTDARHITGNTRLEIIWSVIPLGIVFAFSYMGAQALADTLRVDPNALTVNVTAAQWSWRFEYPDSGITTNELHLPVDRQVLLKMSSLDVIHSFWVPAFRVKQDILPGGKAFERDLRITPDKIGNYTLMCAELCGTRHSYMEAPVIVSSQADFQAWVNSQTAAAGSPAQRGQKDYTTYGCKACHSIDGSAGVGPTWKGLYGSQVKLDDGTTVTADNTYIIESIRNPGAKIVAGFQNVMPAGIGATLTDAQINDLIEFMKTLK
jgi:cytochrome c oxidase subunit 2